MLHARPDPLMRSGNNWGAPTVSRRLCPHILGYIRNTRRRAGTRLRSRYGRKAAYFDGQTPAESRGRGDSPATYIERGQKLNRFVMSIK
jgi:hypothetical protein